MPDNLYLKICYLGQAKQVYLANVQGLSYATSASVGLDLRAILPDNSLTISPGQRYKIPTGICIEPSSNQVAGFIYSRSGLGATKGLTVAQGVGVIDPDYRGEIQVVLLNTSQDAYTIQHGERIAQLIFQPIIKAQLIEVTTLTTTMRGQGGFGHTGII